MADPERVYFQTDGSMIAVAGDVGYLIKDRRVVARQSLESGALSILGYVP